MPELNLIYIQTPIPTPGKIETHTHRHTRGNREREGDGGKERGREREGESKLGTERELPGCRRFSQHKRTGTGGKGRGWLRRGSILPSQTQPWRPRTRRYSSPRGKELSFLAAQL